MSLNCTVRNLPQIQVVVTGFCFRVDGVNKEGFGEIFNIPYKAMSVWVGALQLIKLIIEEQVGLVLHQPLLVCVVGIIRLPG